MSLYKGKEKRKTTAFMEITKEKKKWEGAWKTIRRKLLQKKGENMTW